MTAPLQPGTAAAPRVLIGAPASNAGKTTVTCALLRALQQRGHRPLACKCGPDYIDPMFHARVTGVASRNLDLFLASAQLARQTLARASANSSVTLLEGAMGYYDGIAMGEDASAWDVARTTQTPALLVVDARGRALSLAAEVAGFMRFREPSMIAGIILNRASAGMLDRLASSVEAEVGVPVLGGLPALPDCSFESRHLGLVSAGEIADLQHKLDQLASAAEEYIDIGGLLRIAAAAPALPLPTSKAKPAGQPVCIAIARDEAFSFYYDDTLDALEDAGAQLVPFSPLRDAQLPRGACGLYLGGGYPELHARALSDNAPMRDSIRAALANGMPLIAECGGFLYLHSLLTTEDGAGFPLVGGIDAKAFPTGKLGRFGYVTLHAHNDSLLCEAGDTLRAHEFHYWDSTNPGSSFTAVKPQSTRSWECCHSSATMYAGFPHLYLAASPKATQRFVDACRAYGRASVPEGW